MWVKTADKQYVDLNNGTVIFVSRYHENAIERFRLQVESRNYAPKTLGAGYTTEDEGLAALDEFMSGEDFREIQPPVTEEEKAEEANSTVDSESEETK